MSDAEPAVDELIYHRPEDVPPDLSLIEKAIIAFRNMRAWADWYESTAVKAPPVGGELTDIGEHAGENTR